EAPEAMVGLPAPTHAFVGGSTGRLKDIVDALLEKNPKVRIVITSVTLETLAETARCMKDPNIFEEETLCVNISKAKMAGSYHLMTAQNPVYITVCRGSSA
ncbi:MAG: bifunctional cobalt-precorrin-7 (C(5))-methyltransferase/cobalt-precorrin-6B (C(15))-methyltransferase, partial [Candidatus Methanomethylophilaceae archaeon]|nr:bifunctional cobalt-precorrin-7 (C(5))-methyltransferase/cobalt-precorrin-6B (C(15))-methyltransferase [Candidatus Methanomethylophilaceae archaeon]